jgi:LmbE family N-acetylglucosaminyl deacetylase
MGLRRIAAIVTSRVAGVLSEPLRGPVRSSLRALLKRGSRSLSPAEIGASAVVFAPHPDDETLGCGGTVALKRRNSVEVTIAFMTDGAASDPAASPDQLAKERQGEALAACRVLGVQRDHIQWFGFPDGRLSGCADPAAEVVAALLNRVRPAQVFIPYGFGEHPDHAATGRIVLAALGRGKSGSAPAVFEYPIWFWRHWPWVGIHGPQAPHLFNASLRASFGAKLCREFTRRVDVTETLEQKRVALNEHHTQMTRTRAGTPSLAEVSGGEFLKCFFDGHERFHEVAPFQAGPMTTPATLGKSHGEKLGLGG